MDSPEQMLRALYAAFEARDMDRVLAALAPDVDWPNAWEGGRLRGRDAVRDYWTRQWAAIDPHVTPAGFSTLPGGRVRVDVQQVVRDLDGALVAEGRVAHVYTLGDDGLITAMDVEEA
jgi:nuclear transport factor 2 (NTF2) superfamily protein